MPQDDGRLTAIVGSALGDDAILNSKQFAANWSHHVAPESMSTPAGASPTYGAADANELNRSRLTPPETSKQ